MRRNTITLVPRRSLFPGLARNRARERILSRLDEHFPVHLQGNRPYIEIEFLEHVRRRAAEDQIVAELDRIDTRWHRLFAIYPSETSFRAALRRRRRRVIRAALVAAAGALAVAGGVAYLLWPAGWVWWIASAAAVPLGLLFTLPDDARSEAAHFSGLEGPWGPP